MLEACGWLVLKLLYIFCMLSVGLCILTYHVHNNYIMYTVAVRLDFSQLCGNSDCCFEF